MAVKERTNMTLPLSPSNNLGPHYTSNVPVNSDPAPAPAAAANVAQTVPTPATFNANNGEQSTQVAITKLVTNPQQGTAYVSRATLLSQGCASNPTNLG